MTDERKITVVKRADCDKMQPDKLSRLIKREVLQEVEALECEVGRINKRISALKELLKAA